MLDRGVLERLRKWIEPSPGALVNLHVRSGVLNALNMFEVHIGTRLGHRAPHAHSATAHIPLPLLQVRALAQFAAARLRREPAGAHEAPKGRPCRVDETARARKSARVWRLSEL